MGEKMDCVRSARQSHTVAAVSENPYQVDPPLDCYSYNSYTKIKLVYDPGFMTCFYKGMCVHLYCQMKKKFDHPVLEGIKIQPQY